MRTIKQKDDVPNDTTQGYGFAKIETLHKMSIAITPLLVNWSAMMTQIHCLQIGCYDVRMS
jgi:hypothetical protein